MKLVIQIPCYNEEDTLAETLQDLPGKLTGIDEIQVIVIDDGSEDRTSQVARELGVDKVIRIPLNTGLANAFAVGLKKAIEQGADIVVNTDGDNQYRGEDIQKLIEPILAGEAEMVIGDRQVASLEHFSKVKRFLQKFGSFIVRWASGTRIPDTTSGFRAFSRDAAQRLSIFSGYTYTLETIIQAGKKGIAVTSVAVGVNVVERQSRLIQSTASYILRSGLTILRIFMMYEALRVFLSLSAIPIGAGLFLLARFGYFYLIGDGSGHVQSLVVASILMVLGFVTALMGLLADLIARNWRLSEDIIYLIRSEHSQGKPL